MQITSVYSSSYKVSKLAYVRTFVINVLSKYIYVIRKRERINDESRQVVIFVFTRKLYVFIHETRNETSSRFSRHN